MWRKPNIDELELTPGDEKKDGGSFVDDMNNKFSGQMHANMKKRKPPKWIQQIQTQKRRANPFA